MAVKANLKIQLFADKVVVAESEDEHLWRKVLAAMQGAIPNDTPDENEIHEEEEKITGLEPPSATKSKGISGLAKALDVKGAALTGACDPKIAPPYLHLDEKCWEAFKKNTPARGRKAVAATQLAGTLLCLWFKYGGISGRPSQAQTLEILDGIGVTDNNASRAINNCAWLQSRRDGIQINPAEMTQAEAVAKAFIAKQIIDTKE